jgi:bifunctional non-homologous end joining protein LigD
MLATPWPQRFNDPGWIYEPKWDGVRGILYWDGRAVSIRTRSGLEVSGRYPELTGSKLPAPCVLDGEVVVFDDTGRASFERLQQRLGAGANAVGRHPVSYVAFDMLHSRQGSMVTAPLEERLGALAGLGLTESLMHIDPVDDADALWSVVVDRDLEGVVAKRRGSDYRPGVRSPNWRKMAHLHTVKAVVGGFTPGEGGRNASFGSLVLGLWQGDRLRWIGSVGTGFSDGQLSAIREALDQQTRKAPPFLADPELPPATWVEPVLVAAVAYRNWTNAGRIRHPRFKGFTDDPADEATWEAEGP